MTIDQLSLFKALGAKMDFINQRQRVLSQNIANADTPGYRPQEMVDVDFSNVLKNIDSGNKMPSVNMNITDKQHLPPDNQIGDAEFKKQKKTYEVAPAGNAVIMEEQLMKANQNMMDYNLMTNLYQKNTRMLQIALGVNR